MGFLERWKFHDNAERAGEAAKFTIELEKLLEEALHQPQDVMFYRKSFSKIFYIDQYVLDQIHVVRTRYKAKNIIFQIQGYLSKKMENGDRFWFWEDIPCRKHKVAEQFRVVWKRVYNVETANLLDI